MPSDKSIPQGHQRPSTPKRHVKVPDEGFQHAADDVENMSLDELEWQLDKTINEILDLTRRYMNQYNARWEKGGRGEWGTGQIDVAWIVSRAHWEGSAKDIEAAWDEHMNDPISADAL